MSAFLCSPRTFAHALIAHCKCYTRKRPYGYIPITEHNDDKYLASVLDGWISLNQASINHRYPDKNDPVADDINKRVIIERAIRYFKAHTVRGERPYILQLWQSINCLIYQCSEGEVNMGTLTYADLVRMKHDIADEILSQMPGSEDLHWG